MLLPLPVVATLVLTLCAACNVHELTQIVQNRFRQQGANCGGEGDKCSFDRDCCKGLECKMAASKLGIDSYCERRARAASARGDMAEAWEDYNASDADQATGQESHEQSSAEAWMLAEPADPDPGATDTLDEIDQFQQKKRTQLLKENEELERLFTEKEQNELEQLRALKEDAEMDELRRLKELRLQRKLDLIKELKALRGATAAKYLDMIDELKNVSEPTTTTTATHSNLTNFEAQPSLDVPLDQASFNHSQVDREETADEDGQPESTTRHRQGIRHKHKHHPHRHKHPTNANTTQVNVNVE